jgi:hypothetical protein
MPLSRDEIEKALKNGILPGTIMTSKGLWPFFMKMWFSIIGQVEKSGEKSPQESMGTMVF